MDTSRILIIGAKGQLGTALSRRFSKATAVDRDELDITSLEALKKFEWSAIDIILNAAAYTSVDGAETPEGRRLAWQINAQAPAWLSAIATQYGLALCHISSEYVFDGTISPHKESEPLSPLGIYAQTKAAGDLAVSTTAKHYILRTSWLIGDGPNFVRTMMGLAIKNISPTVVDDQIGRLTFTPVLAEAMVKLIETNAPHGIYNVSNDGEPASWADVTRTIFSRLGRDGLIVTGTSTEDYFRAKPEAAPRPLQSAFDLTKIKAASIVLPDWRTELHAYIDNELKKEQPS